MWVYEVRSKLSPEIQEAYIEWLVPHADEVVRAGGFDGCKILVDYTDPTQLVTQYFAKSQSIIDTYIAGPAQELRADAQRRFGGRFQASRQIYKVILQVP